MVIDFGNRLKSVLSSLVFSDVSDDSFIITTINQWFDRSIFYENSIKEIYYPSVNYKNFLKYRENYFKNFKTMPSEITILGYDAIGLIYYVWKKDKNISSVKNFIFKENVKGKIGKFNLKNGRVSQKLKIYQAKNKAFRDTNFSQFVKSNKSMISFHFFLFGHLTKSDSFSIWYEYWIISKSIFPKILKRNFSFNFSKNIKFLFLLVLKTTHK